jgi:hypothetical protein
MTLHEQQLPAWVRDSAIRWRKLLIVHRSAFQGAWCKVFPRHDFGTARLREEHHAASPWAKVAREAWEHPGWRTAAREYHQARGGRVLVLETKPEQVARLRRLMSDDVSIERGWNEVNDPRNRPTTPQMTVEAIMVCVRERGVAALQEPANQERLSGCDAAARQQINERIEKLSKKAGGVL